MRNHSLFASFSVAFTLMAAQSDARELKVIADMSVTASLVQQVMGDLGKADILLDQGADPHHFLLRPSQAQALQKADILFWIGPELTPWLSRAAAQMSDKRQYSLLTAPETVLRDYNSAHEDHEHSGDKSGSHSESDSNLDPHAWLDPENGVYWLDVIAIRLGELDPENSEQYHKNAAMAQKRISRTDAAMKKMLTPVRDRSFVTFHDAYGYFTSHYELQDSIAVSLGDATAPSAGRLRKVQSEVSESGASCAFPEVGQPAELIKIAVMDAGIGIGNPLSPTGSGIPVGPDLYNTLLTSLGHNILACLTEHH